MAFNVNEIRANLIGDGARPSLFEVTMVNPASATGDALLRYMVRTAQIPASIINPIEVPYFGRRIKLAGSRTYPNWSVTVMNDENFAVRSALEAWSSQINSGQTNLRTLNNYRSTAKVIQYGKDGTAIRTYEFYNIFPIEIGQIDLDWENGDSVETFNVEFAYDYWVVDDSTIVN
jgi:hypothetical protein